MMELKGKLTASGVLKGKLTASGALRGRLQKVTGYDTYQGEYEVVPQNFAQVLETMDKLMNDDVRVHPIQYRETPLSAGGLEISIGGSL